MAITFDELPAAVTQVIDSQKDIKELLEKILSKQAPVEDEILTIDQVAGILRLSVPTIYGLVAARKIPFSKTGKRLYFSRQDITAWIKKSRKKTMNEIKEEA